LSVDNNKDYSNQPTAAFDVRIKEMLVEWNSFLTTFEMSAIEHDKIAILCNRSNKRFTTTFVPTVYRLVVESKNCSFINYEILKYY